MQENRLKKLKTLQPPSLPRWEPVSLFFQEGRPGLLCTLPTTAGVLQKQRDRLPSRKGGLFPERVKILGVRKRKGLFPGRLIADSSKGLVIVTGAKRKPVADLAGFAVTVCGTFLKRPSSVVTGGFLRIHRLLPPPLLCRPFPACIVMLCACAELPVMTFYRCGLNPCRVVGRVGGAGRTVL